jgi:hypothetical protein
MAMRSDVPGGDPEAAEVRRLRPWAQTATLEAVRRPPVRDRCHGDALTVRGRPTAGKSPSPECATAGSESRMPSSCLMPKHA